MRTPLEVLVAAQAVDAVSFRVHSLSVDAFPSGADLIYRYSRKRAHDPRHGTLNCYTNLRCRCVKCRAASAAAKREWRRRNRADKGVYRYRTCCAECGSTTVRRERVYEATA